MYIHTKPTDFCFQFQAKMRTGFIDNLVLEQPGLVTIQQLYHTLIDGKHCMDFP